MGATEQAKLLGKLVTTAGQQTGQEETNAKRQRFVAVLSCFLSSCPVCRGAVMNFRARFLETINNGMTLKVVFVSCEHVHRCQSKSATQVSRFKQSFCSGQIWYTCPNDTAMPEVHANQIKNETDSWLTIPPLFLGLELI